MAAIHFQENFLVGVYIKGFSGLILEMLPRKHVTAKHVYLL